MITKMVLISVCAFNFIKSITNKFIEVITLKTVLITGVAGFIGFHVAKRLLKEKFNVIGIDNLNSYYDVTLKERRLKELESLESDDFVLYRESIEEQNSLNSIFKMHKPSFVINLAAQAGVQYSTENPRSYIDSNLVGFSNILECCRENKIQKLIYASSSSVYGANKKIPFSESDSVDHPLTLYAATKRANELIAHTYSYLYQIPCIGLRFFTVYGPWGRPDMSIFKFVNAILKGESINVNNFGESLRDFTYIDDVVESIYRLLIMENITEKQTNDDNSPNIPYKLFNVGNNNPIKLIDAISLIEEKLKIKATKNFLPLPNYDVPNTFADVNELNKAIKFTPKTTIQDGINNFIDWYLEYYKTEKKLLLEQ